MSRFREELKVIPRAMRIAVAFVLLGLSSAFTLFLMFSHDQDLARTPEAGKILMIVGIGIVPAIWLLLIGYVYADSKRRGMNSTLWTLLVIFVPKAIGFIAYFLLRKPLMRPCPHCGTNIGSDFRYCPKCGYAVTPMCAHCGHSIKHDYVVCPYCGKSVIQTPAITPPSTQLPAEQH